MKRIICFFLGHKIMAGLFEDDEIITSPGCSRCGHFFITSRTRWKGLRNCIPPSEYRGTWEQFNDKEDEKLRQELRQLVNH